MAEKTGPIRNSVATRLTHAEVVRIALESEIFTGELRPGASIDEEGLSQRFQVSRTPVREAILQLVQAGLLEKKSRKGAAVARLDLHQLVQMFETISELEGLSARLATRRMTPDEIEALIATHDESQRAMDAGDEDEYAALGRKFHAQILEGSRNDVLIEITRKLAAKVVPYRRFQLRRTGRVWENQSDHQAIIDAMTRRDADEAYNLMRKHGAVQGDVMVDFISFDARY